MITQDEFNNFETIGNFTQVSDKIAVGLLALDKHSRLVLQLRDNWEWVQQNGYWCVFGGGLEEHESLAECCLREFHEETNIQLSINDITPVSVSVGWAPNYCQHFLYRSTKIIDIQKINVGEGAGFGAFDKGQLQNLDIEPSLKAPIYDFAEKYM